MRAIELTEPSLEAFRPTELVDPVPGSGEVLIRLRAASLNFIDIAVATGNFPVSGFPLVPVADGAGEVVGLGPGVSNLREGDRVMPHFLPFWQGGLIAPGHIARMRGVTLPGSLAEYVVVPESGVVAMPDHLSFAQAATLPIVATTAWRALNAANIGPGSVVVLLGTGGVSILGLQLAKACGATVIVTSSSDEKLERASALGADKTINYRAFPAWDAEVLKCTGGRGADLIIETGGAKTFSQSLNTAAFGGVIFSIGFLTGTAATFDLLPIIVKGLKIQGNNTGPVSDLAAAARAIHAHRIMPVVDREFGINEASAAYSHLAAGSQHFAKIAIVH